jgi:hypothetical protein
MVSYSQAPMTAALARGRRERSRQFRKIASLIWKSLTSRPGSKPDLSFRPNRGADLCNG